MRLRTVIASVACLLVLAAPAVAHAQYGGSQGMLVDPASAFPGDTVRVIGTGCEPLAEIIFTMVVPVPPPPPTNGDADATTTEAAPAFEEREVGTTRATRDGDGGFVADITLPESLTPGIHTLTARCGDLELTADIEILDADDGPDGPLAFTDDRDDGISTPWLLIGLVATSAPLFWWLLGPRRSDDEDEELDEHLAGL